MTAQDRGHSKQNSIDARQQLTYDTIKNAGATLCTIQANTGGDPTSPLLRSCASRSGKFFLLTAANQIAGAFNTIGTNCAINTPPNNRCSGRQPPRHTPDGSCSRGPIKIIWHLRLCRQIALTIQISGRPRGLAELHV
jgi:hypothetical protein